LYKTAGFTVHGQGLNVIESVDPCHAEMTSHE
jgi:hypothetical protein